MVASHVASVYVQSPGSIQMLIVVLTYVVCLKVLKKMFFVFSHVLPGAPSLGPTNVQTKLVLMVPSAERLERQCTSLN